MQLAIANIKNTQKVGGCLNSMSKPSACVYEQLKGETEYQTGIWTPSFDSNDNLPRTQANNQK